MDIRQVKFGEYSIGSAKAGIQRNDSKKGDEKTQEALVENKSIHNPENVLNAIVEKSGVSSNSYVLEIGPGAGVLTYALAKVAKKMSKC